MAQLPVTDPIANLTNVLGLFNGKETETTDSPTTRTTTTKSNLTSEQLSALIQQEMLPLAQAGHAAGISGYGDTTLKLGRDQVAGNILAKAAGSTTTETTSGGTRTTSNPGPLSSSRIGDTAKSLLLTQFGAPALKKLGSKFDGASIVDSILGGSSVGPAASATGITDVFGPMGATDAIGTASQAADMSSIGLDSLLGTGLEAGLADAGAGALTDSITDTVGGGDSIGDFFSSLFGLKDGGMVRVPQKYATGGVVGVDRTPAAINPTPAVNPTVSATGEVDPNPQIPRATGSTPVSASSGKTATVKNSANLAAFDEINSASVGGSGGGPTNGTLGGFGWGILGSMLGHNPMGMAINAISKGLSQPEDISTMATPEDSDPTGQNAMQAVNDAIAQDANSADAGAIGSGLGLGLGLGSSDGLGDSSGLGMGEGSAGNVADGGEISGPGTGTSDSINAKVSNGETIITAQTTKGIKQVLGDDFLHQLEQIFNPKAAAVQVAKGRI